MTLPFYLLLKLALNLSTKKVMDAAQLRQQIARLHESEHTLELDNLNLRKKLSQLQENQPLQLINTKLIKFIEILKQTLNDIRNDQIKSKQAFDKDIVNLKSKLNQYNKVIRENILLKKNISNLQKTIDINIKTNKEQSQLLIENERLNIDYKSSQTILKSYESDIATLQYAISQLSTKNDSLKHETTQLITKLDKYKDEYKKLKMLYTNVLTEFNVYKNETHIQSNINSSNNNNEVYNTTIPKYIHTHIYILYIKFIYTLII